MKFFKRTIISIFLMLFALSIFNKAKASSNLYLNNLNFDVQINSDGSMDIVETWNIDISNTNTLYKTFKVDSNKYSSITNGKVSKVTSSGAVIPLIDSGEYAYHVPIGEYYFLKIGSNYEVAWGTGYENSSETATYKISYHVNDAVALYNDCAEMYWQFIGSDFEVPARKITGTIKLPKEVQNIDELRVWGHTPDLNGTITKESNDTVKFEINNNKAEKMVEVRISIPRDEIIYSGRTYNANKLSTILQEEKKWKNDTSATRVVEILISTILGLIVFGILIYFAVRNIKVLLTVKKVVPSTHYDYYRDLPRQDATPAEALYILEENYQGFNKDDLGKIFSSTILNLSLKKYIKIEEAIDKSKDDTKITILDNNQNQVQQLNSDEIIIYNFLITACKNKAKSIGISQVNLSENEITMKELKTYINSNGSKVVKLKSSLDNAIKSKLLNNNILDLKGIKIKNANKVGGSLGTVILFVIIFLLMNKDSITDFVNLIGIPWYLLVIAFILLIADFVLISLANKRISVYTQEGVDEVDKWKALKKYMEDYTILKEKDVPDLALWEKYLVYATAFGISEKLIKELEIVYPDSDNSDYEKIYTSVVFNSNVIFSSSYRMVSNSRPTSLSSGSGEEGDGRSEEAGDLVKK